MSTQRKPRTIRVTCSRCGGEGALGLESPACAIPCPLCENGWEQVPAGEHLRGFLCQRKDKVTSFQELAALYDAAADDADRRAESHRQRGDTQRTNAATVEAEVLCACRDALLARLGFTRITRKATRQAQATKARGAAAFGGKGGA